MGLFDKFKKKEKIEETKQNPLLLSMPMFNSDDVFSLDDIINDLKTYWGLNVTDQTGNDEVSTFIINGETVAIGLMPAPIPENELKPICEYSYLWNNALEEIEKHTSHAIVSVLGSNTNILERYKILTKLNASILRTTTNSIGVYKGNQTLLLPKDLYLDFANFLKGDGLPIPLWVYLGLMNNETESSIYTYGLKEFKKLEIEILNSSLKGNDLYDFLLSIITYIIESDVTLKNGETIGFSEKQKIKITESKGVFLDGKTLKLEI